MMVRRLNHHWMSFLLRCLCCLHHHWCILCIHYYRWETIDSMLLPLLHRHVVAAAFQTSCVERTTCCWFSVDDRVPTLELPPSLSFLHFLTHKHGEVQGEVSRIVPSTSNSVSCTSAEGICRRVHEATTVPVVCFRLRFTFLFGSFCQRRCRFFLRTDDSNNRTTRKKDILRMFLSFTRMSCAFSCCCARRVQERARSNR
jgi:hypothetical protein